MRIDRRAHRPAPGLHVGEEAQQRRQVVAFGKALLLHQAFALWHGVGIEKAVGGDEIDLGTFGQRASSACNTRAVVDLPTATEPATPMTYGILVSSVPRKPCCALNRRCADCT